MLPVAGGTGHKRQGRIRTGAFALSHFGWLRGLAGGPVLWSGWRANPKGWLACTGGLFRMTDGLV